MELGTSGFRKIRPIEPVLLEDPMYPFYDGLTLFSDFLGKNGNLIKAAGSTLIGHRIAEITGRQSFKALGLLGAGFFVYRRLIDSDTRARNKLNQPQ